MSVLHVPIDFELSDSVRRLSIRLGNDRALAIALRLWCDWGRVGKEWRALDGTGVWKDEPLTHIIERYCGWDGEPGEMIVRCLEAGVLCVEKRGDIEGIGLPDFWRFNEHLSPSHKTIQQKGGKAKAIHARLREVDTLAVQQVRLFEIHQADLPLVSGAKASEEELRLATALVMRLDVACDKPQRRTEDFSELVAPALVVVRAFTFEDVDTVCRYLIKNSEDPSVVKEPGLILAAFGEFLRKAKGL